MTLTSGSRRWRVGAGETVALAHVCWSRDEREWGPDCLDFRADRDEYGAAPADRDPRARLRSDDVAFAVFSQGWHKCPGEKLAHVLVATTLAVLLENGVAPEHPIPPLSFERATLAQRTRPVAATCGRSK